MFKGCVRSPFPGFLVLMLFLSPRIAPGASLLTNASFDTPTNTTDFIDTGWNAHGTNAMYRIGWAARSGPMGGYFQGWWSPSLDAGVDQLVAATTGTYTFALWILQEPGFNPSYTYLKLEWYDAATNLLRGATNDLTRLPGDFQWHHVHVTDACTNPAVALVRGALVSRWNWPTHDETTASFMFDDAALYTGAYQRIETPSNVGFEHSFTNDIAGSRWYALPVPHLSTSVVEVCDWAFHAGNFGMAFQGWRGDSNSYSAVVGQNFTPGPGGYEFSVFLLREAGFLLTNAQLRLEWFDATYTNKVLADTVTNVTVPADGGWHAYSLVGICTNAGLFEVRAQVAVGWNYNSTNEASRAMKMDNAFLYAFDAGSQPDLLIRRRGWGGGEEEAFAGDGVYTNDAAGQTKFRKLEHGQTAIYELRMENTHAVAHEFKLRGDGPTGSWSIAYFDAATGSNITSQVTGSGWQKTVDAGLFKDIRLEVAPSNSAPDGGAHDVWVTCAAVADTNQSDTVRAITEVSSPGSPTPIGDTWTNDSDFAEGFMDRTMVLSNAVRLGGGTMSLPFIWVPNSNEGTVSKVDTRTGRELARYRTAPGTNGNPSRTTMDQYGNCWVANRYLGTVAKIGLRENNQYLDRNTNGIIETSSDTNGDGFITGDEILPWGQDECVLFEEVLIPGLEGTYAPGTYTNTYASDDWNPGPRGLAVDAQGNLWAGCPGTHRFYYINGRNGDLLRTNYVGSHKSYGAIVDKNGILWSAGHDGDHVLRLDPVANTSSVVNVGHFVYGLGLDTSNHLFASGWDESSLSRIDVLTATLEWTTNAPYQARGVAVTPKDNDVWVVKTPTGSVSRYANSGVLKSTIRLGRFSEPTGIAADLNGNVWVVDFGDEFVHRINPDTEEIELSRPVPGARHYGYSDMCGTIANQITRNGSWSVTHNAAVTNTPWTWGGTLTWDAYAPAGTALRVKVRSSNNLQDWSDWEAATNGNLNSVNPGKYLQIRVELEWLSQTAEIPYFENLRLSPAADADGDLLADPWETWYGQTNPGADPDLDGLNNSQEYWYGTRPDNGDTDNDGLTDGDEVNTWHTNPRAQDTDGDGLIDGDEVNTLNTDPLKSDTDGDGLGDGAEINTYTTDPLKADTDEDGMSDGHEVRAGTGPKDNTSFLALYNAARDWQGTEAVVRWSSVGTKSYTLLRSTNLSQGFSPISTNLAATPDMNTYTDVNAAANACYYYLIQLE